MQPSPTPGSTRRVFPIVLMLALAACAAPASAVPELPPTLPPTSEPTAPPTATASPAPTEAPSPTPTATEPPADRTISPATLGQLRPLWVLEEPGNPNAQPGCQDTACWMASRLGGYAFSPDGETLAVGVCTVDSTENTTNPRLYRFNCDGPAEVRLYDAGSGALRRSLTVGDFPLSLAFHPDGKTLAAGMAHRSIEIWDLAAGKKVQTLLHSTTHTGVEGLVFSPDGGLLVSDGDGLLQLWQWERGLPAGMIEGATNFAFSPDGLSLATLSWSGDGSYVEARFYAPTDPASFRAFRLDWRKQPSAIVYTPDGSALIAVGFTDLELVEPTSGKILRQAKSDTLLRGGAFTGYTRARPEQTAGGRLVLTANLQDAAGGYYDTVGLWDPLDDGATVALLSPDGVNLAVGDAFFAGFSFSAVQLAPGDHYLLARESLFGTFWIWGVDPTASPAEVTCLGTCNP